MNEPGGNGKDPWSGRKPEQGPPDLDELFRKLSRKVSGIFSSNTGADEGGKGTGTGAGVGVIIFALVTIWVLSGVFIVHPAENGVIKRFGRYVKIVGSGPHWIPRFIETKTILNVEKVSNFSYQASMLTKDENIVSVAVAVKYRIANPKDYLFNVVNPPVTLQQATASALRQVIGHTTLDEILTTGREVVRQNIQEQVEKILEIYHAGVMVVDIDLQQAKAPEEVKSAFDDAIKAQEDEQRFINQAQAYAKGVIPIAQGHAKRVSQEALAYKQDVILQAKGNTAKFSALLPVYNRAPTVTGERMYLDTVEKVLSNTSKILLDVKGSNNLVYLPLDKILQQGVQSVKAPEKIIEEPSTLGMRETTPERPSRETYNGRGEY